MTQVSFKGSGTSTPDTGNIGFGQGLQVGLTNIDFAKGIVDFTDSIGKHDMGRFVGLHGQDASNLVVAALVFKAKTKCTLVIDQVSYDYETIGEWVTFNHLNISRMQVNRTATGQNPDVFDFQFIASDDPEYRFTIQQANRDSESEVIFANAQRAIATYTQKINLRGARKIIVIGNSPASAETGTAKITMEIFDVGSNQWVQIASELDLFTLSQGLLIQKPVGEEANKRLGDSSTDYEMLWWRQDGTKAIYQGSEATPSGGAGGSVDTTPFNNMRPIYLPSGDNILRFRADVATNPLTFSLSITKVFD